MKILVLGGCGNIGSSIARDLIKSNDVEKVDLVDINPDPARIADSVRKSKKVTVAYLDVMESYSELVKTVQGNDLVINCVAPYPQFGTEVLRAAIDAGVNYADVCDDCSKAMEYFELDGSARKAGVTACTGLGLTPGLTNVLARYGARQLDTVSDIGIYFIIALIDPIGRGGLAQAVGQFDGNVWQYLNGKLTEVPAGTGGEKATFMKPFGENEVFYARHPEPFTLPRSIPGVSNVTDKAIFTPPSVPKLFREIMAMGLLSDECLTVGTASISPRDFIVTYVHQNPDLRSGPAQGASIAANVVVRGMSDDALVTHTYRVSGWGGPLVAIPASIGVQMICGSSSLAKGVMAPEAIIDEEEFLEKLGKKGILINRITTTER